VKVNVLVVVLVTYTRTVLVVRLEDRRGILCSGSGGRGNSGVHFPTEDSGSRSRGDGRGRESGIAVRYGCGRSSNYN